VIETLCNWTSLKQGPIVFWRFTGARSVIAELGAGPLHSNGGDKASTPDESLK
jgi:hypothetical protein